MAKKQTRRSISVSRTTYEKLKAFCETNNISMSQFVETRVGDFLGEGATTTIAPAIPKPTIPARPLPPKSEARPVAIAPMAASAQQPVPMTSAAARFAIEPPPPIIKPKQEQAAPKPAEKRPDQIFTF
ncbi:MAG TPA: hypothetical protein VGG74_00335 [Kofleriaceae bacterium]|jgi:hypothetical protein